MRFIILGKAFIIRCKDGWKGLSVLDLIVEGISIVVGLVVWEGAWATFQLGLEHMFRIDGFLLAPPWQEFEQKRKEIYCVQESLNMRSRAEVMDLSA